MPFLPADERLRKVRIGIDSYTNTELVLDVIGFTNLEGKSGIGSVPTLDSPELFVDGNGYFTGVVTATTFFAGPTEITGGAFADNLTVTTLQVNGLSTFSGNVELDNNAKLGIGSTPTAVSPELFVDGDGYFTGVVTATTFFAGPTEITGGAAVDNLEVEQLNVSGLSTFGGFITTRDSMFIDGDLTISGDLLFSELALVGIITFLGDVDNVLGDPETGTLQVIGGVGIGKNVSIGSSLFVNTQVGIGTSLPTAALDVFGDTDLDDLNVSGLSTFASDVDINASVDVLDDLTVNNNFRVVGLSTFGSAVDINADLDVDGFTELDTTNISETLNVVGISTFGSNVDINASVDISNDLVVNDALNVTGLSTFQSNVRLLDNDRLLFGTDEDNLKIYYNGLDSYIDANGSQGLRIINNEIRFTDVGNNQLLRISGNSAGIVQLSYRPPIGASSVKFETTGYGVTVFGGLNVSGLSTFGSNVDINASVDISNDLVVNDALNVTGLSTFASDVDINASVDISGDLVIQDALNVTGLSTFSSNVDINASVDISGDLVIQDALNVTGLSTFGDNVDINASVDISQTLNVTGVATFGNNVEITGDLTVNGNQTILNTQILEVEDINIGIASADPKLSDAALDGAGITIHGAAGDKTLTWSNANSRMEFNTDLYAPKLETGLLDVTGVSTFGGNVDINASVDISNDLVVNDALNVTGLSTFGSDVDINASVDISNDLVVNDALNVTGLSTFGSDVDINASVDVLDDLTVNNNFRVVGLSTFEDDVNIGVGGTTAFFDVDTGNVGIGSTQPDATLTVDINQSSGTFTGNVADVGYVDSTLGRRSIFQIAAQSFRYDTTNLGSKTTFRFGSFASNTGWVGLHYGVHPNPVVYQTSLSNTTGVSGVNSTGYFAWTSGTYFTDYNSWDLRLYRDDAGILAQRNETNPNTFRVYNTYTSSTNFERANVGWTTDVFIVGTEKGVDGGSPRQLELQTDGTTRVAITTTGLVGIGSTQPTATLDVNGTLNVTGLSTFGDNVDINASVDISNDLVVNDALNVTGLSTFGDNVDINASVDISQTLNVTGVATFGNNVEITGDLTVNGNQTILNTQILEVEDINIGIASADPKLSDAALDGAGLTIHGAAGDKTLTWNNSNTRMEFNTYLYAPVLQSINLEVSGVSTFSSNVDINASADISGDLVIQDALNVTGLSTFGSNVDINASVDISNDLVVNDALNVTGLSTLTGQVQVDNDINVTGVITAANFIGAADDRFTGLSSNFNAAVGILSANNYISGVITQINFTGTNLDVSVTVEPDNLTQANVDILRVAGADEADFALLAGIATNVIGGIASVTQLSVSGLSTFNDAVDINADVDISDDLTVNGNLTVVGLSTFTSDITVNGDSTFNGNINSTGIITATATDGFTGLSSNFNGAIGILSANNYISGVITQINFTGTNLDVSVTVEPDNLTQANVDILRVAGADEADFAVSAGVATNVIGGIASVTQLSVSGISTFEDNVYIGVGGTTAFFEVDTGNVGIGSTQPIAELDVNGGVNVSGVITAAEFVGIGSQLTDITFRQLSDVDGSNLVALGAGTTTPDYLVIYDPTLDSFRFVDPKTYFGINNDFNDAPSIVDYGVF